MEIRISYRSDLIGWISDSGGIFIYENCSEARNACRLKVGLKGGLLQFSEEKDQDFEICEIKATECLFWSVSHSLQLISNVILPNK